MKNSLEEQFRNLYATEEKAVPDKVWQNIESVLDKKESKKRVFGWFTLTSGIAASVIFTMTIIGYKYLQTPSQEISLIEADSKTKTTPQIKSSSDKETLSEPDHKFSKNPDLHKDSQPVVIENPRKLWAKNTQKATLSINEGNINYNNKSLLTSPTFTLNPENNISSNLESNTQLATNEISSKERVESAQMNLIEPIRLSKINTRTVLPRPMLSTPYLYPDKIVDAVVTTKKVFLSLNSGISPFNANFKEPDGGLSSASFSVLKTADTKNTNVANTQYTEMAQVPSTIIDRGVSQSLGIEIGKKLKKNFTLLSGLRIAHASLSQQTNTLSIDQETGQIKSFFAANYIEQKPLGDLRLDALSSNSTQTYDFLQIPLLLSYSHHIGPKLEIEATTGLGADVFIQTLHKGELIADTKYKAGNSNFRPVNMSGQGRLGLNYKVYHKWSLNLFSSFQKALFSGINANISFKPQFAGIGYGLRYDL